MIQSINPYSGEVLQTIQEATDAQVNKALQQAERAFADWRTTGFDLRAKHMNRAATLLKEQAESLARTISLEMGKPISQAVAEVEKCAWVCEYYATQAGSQLEPEGIQTDADESYVRFEPLGPILAIMPWNYPFWQVFRFAAPALMAGNVGLLKHASNVMMSAAHISRILLEAGFPEGCFQHLPVGSKRIGDLIAHKTVKAVTLTGSKPAGEAVAAKAGAHIKKTVLELGGSNALLVLDDADLESSVQTCIQARFQNTGQSCIAGKRLLLQKGIARRFKEALLEGVKKLKSGDPLGEETYIGVLAREDLAKDLEEQVRKSVKMGAGLMTGGKRDSSYFEPTLLEQVDPNMPVFKEETFGPALAITVFEQEEDGVALVNQSDFGLGVSVFTSDKARANRLIPQFEEGAVFVNDLVKSDPRLPFGGVKESGYGRELSRHGILEFVNKKTVYLRFS